MNRGFTLIEMLIVGVIIGVLVTLASPEYRKAVEKSRLAEAITLLGDIMKGERMHYLEDGTFTPNLKELMIEMPGLSQEDGEVSSVDTSYYTVALVDSGARATASRKGNASAGPIITFTIDSMGDIKKYCNDSSSTIKVCAGLRQGADWESVEYAEPEPEGISEEALAQCQSECGANNVEIHNEGSNWWCNCHLYPAGPAPNPWGDDWDD